MYLHDCRYMSPRELEVLTLVADGRTNQEIADRLVNSVKTIQAHRANVMEKLGLYDITQLVRFAIRHDLIPADPYTSVPERMLRVIILSWSGPNSLMYYRI